MSTTPDGIGDLTNQQDQSANMQITSNDDPLWSETVASDLTLQRKRRQTATSRASTLYPRKRAVKACEVCRRRKIKCSNERPSCSSCTAIGVTCTYDYQIDLSSLDPASILILSKLDEVLGKLDRDTRDNHGSCGRGSNSNVEENATLTQPSLTTGSNFSQDKREARDGTAERSDDIDFDHMKLPSAIAPAGLIAAWPIFKDRFTSSFLNEELFLNLNKAAPEDGSEASPTSNQKRRGPTIRDEDTILLVERFLCYVHIKNPVLEANQLKAYARQVSETGPKWDASSCLVLLACALGAIAKPFDSRCLSVELVGRYLSHADLDLDSKDLAEQYYLMARRRFGLLEPGIAKIQCHILSGIYLMYNMQPLPAWNDFFQASITCCQYLMGRQIYSERSLVDPTTNNNAVTRRLEQRLYWTCFKTECEMQLELAPLPSSGIGDLDYPYMLPSPPEDLSSPSDMDQLNPSMSQFNNPSTLSEGPTPTPPDQQSWFYYLTEIVLRRINNRIVNAWYQHKASEWEKLPILDMQKTVTHFEMQLTSWKDSLPEPIQFSDKSSTCLEELRFHVMSRYTSILLWLYIPFLYRTIHMNTKNSAEFQINQYYAQKAVAACIDEYDGTGAAHRHHGTWFMCRAVVLRALIILAARRSKDIDVPPCWSQIIEKMICILRYWEAESPDVKKAREVVETLYHEAVEADEGLT